MRGMFLPFFDKKFLRAQKSHKNKKTTVPSIFEMSGFLRAIWFVWDYSIQKKYFP
jgi:hypothetical protein